MICSNWVRMTKTRITLTCRVRSPKMRGPWTRIQIQANSYGHRLSRRMSPLEISLSRTVMTLVRRSHSWRPGRRGVTARQPWQPGRRSGGGLLGSSHNNGPRQPFYSGHPVSIVPNYDNSPAFRGFLGHDVSFHHWAAYPRCPGRPVWIFADRFT